MVSFCRFLCSNILLVVIEMSSAEESKIKTLIPFACISYMELRMMHWKCLNIFCKFIALDVVQVENGKCADNNNKKKYGCLMYMHNRISLALFSFSFICNEIFVFISL